MKKIVLLNIFLDRAHKALAKKRESRKLSLAKLKI